MTIKDCGHHKDKKKILIKRIIIGTTISVSVVILTYLIARAIIKPSKPTFVLQDATLYNFNLTGPAQLTSLFQVTVQAKNPNDKAGIMYDKLITYATYHDQQITLPTTIPPTYQDTNGMNVWSPFLRGDSVPVAPYIGALINNDLQMGSVGLVIKLDGRVKWKLGCFHSAPYHIHVNCRAFIPMGDPNSGILVAKNVMKYQLIQGCSVSM